MLLGKQTVSANKAGLVKQTVSTATSLQTKITYTTSG